MTDPHAKLAAHLVAMNAAGNSILACIAEDFPQLALYVTFSPPRDAGDDLGSLWFRLELPVLGGVGSNLRGLQYALWEQAQAGVRKVLVERLVEKLLTNVNCRSVGFPPPA